MARDSLLGRRVVAIALAGAMMVGSAPALTQERADAIVIDLPTRPGVTVRLLMLAPAGRSRATVVLLPGSTGVSGIPERTAPEWTRGGSFLVRASPGFPARGLAAVIVDAPSDRRRGLSTTFRASAAHLEDIAAVIAEVRRRAGGGPVWLMGHSSGAISVASAAARLPPPQGPDGIVLASSVAYPLGAGPDGRPTGRAPGMAAIHVPALLIHNRGDGCTPLGSAQALRATFTGAPRVELLVLDASAAPQARRCGRFAVHGFNGVEDQAVAAVVAWIERR
jgi:dienelactone hydrolase